MGILVHEDADSVIEQMIPRIHSSGRAARIVLVSEDPTSSFVRATRLRWEERGYDVAVSSCNVGELGIAISSADVVMLVTGYPALFARTIVGGGALDIIKRYLADESSLVIADASTAPSLGLFATSESGDGVQVAKGLGLVSGRVTSGGLAPDIAERGILLAPRQAILVESDHARILSEGAPLTSLDTTPLRERPSRAAVRDFLPAFRRAYPRSRNIGETVRRWIFLILTICAAFILAGSAPFAARQVMAAPEAERVSQATGALMFGVLLVIAYCVIGWSAFRSFLRRRTPRTWYRLAKFARENDLRLMPGNVRWLHTPFALRGQGMLSDGMARLSERPVVFANYQDDTSRRRFGTTHGSIIAVRVNAHLPHVIVNSRRARWITFGKTPSASQRLRMEGDVDRHFAVSVAQGYEADALYLLAPDVLTMLIDNVADYDIEFLGNWVILSSRRDVITLSEDRWQKALRATNALASQVDQWDNWRPTPLTEDESQSRDKRSRRGRPSRMATGLILVCIFAALWFGSAFLLL